MSKHILIYTNCKNQKQADEIISSLLDHKLIACANSYPVDSKYSWKGKIVSEKEITIRLKTISKNYKRIETEILRLHSDEIPEILEVGIVGGLESYLNWVDEQTSQTQKVQM